MIDETATDDDGAPETAGRTAVRAVVGRLVDWVDRLLPALAVDRRRNLRAALMEQFGDRTDSVDAEVCGQIERAAWPYSRHLLLTYEPDGTDPPDTESRGWPEADLAQFRRRAGSITEVRRLADGESVIRIDGLEPPAAALPYVDAAFHLAKDATHLILDLRANGGGSTETLAAIAGWLLGDDAVHLADAHFRDRIRQWWTPSRPTGTAVPARVPVTILTSASTFSNAEALAYHLQARRRARVVGEPTPGAAHYVTPIRLAPTVLGLLPEAVTVDTATGTNWEGSGVIPDIPCPAGEALSTALAAS